jgi:hypothetical protein
LLAPAKNDEQKSDLSLRRGPQPQLNSRRGKPPRPPSVPTR